MKDLLKELLPVNDCTLLKFDSDLLKGGIGGGINGLGCGLLYWKSPFVGATGAGGGGGSDVNRFGTVLLLLNVGEVALFVTGAFSLKTVEFMFCKLNGMLEPMKLEKPLLRNSLLFSVFGGGTGL